MPVTKVMQISALKCTESVLAAGLCADPLGELTALTQTYKAGFKSGGRDKGRRKGKRQEGIDS